LRIDINDVVAAFTSRLDAKAVEQTLIELHVLGRNGGALLNRINSIAQTNPEYAESLRRGTDILRALGYPGL
jgi:filamentous hemagglutinin